MKDLAKMGVINGIDKNAFDGINGINCADCITSKMRESKHPKGVASRATRMGQLIHIDGKGPISPMSRHGFQYFLTVVDDYSKMRWSVLCKRKSEYFSAFERIAAIIENHCNRRIETVRSDNEFRSYSFSKWIRARGASQEFTVPYSPAQNGVAERSIGTTMECTRAILSSSGLGLNFWDDAVIFSTFVLNCIPTNGTATKNTTPYELWNYKKPAATFLRKFGAKCYGFIPTAARLNRSLGPRAIECKYLGVSEDQKGFRLYINSSKRVMVSRTVVFTNDENEITDYLDIKPEFIGKTKKN